MTNAELTPGQLVEWLYEARGGYGYTAWVCAKVVKVNRVKVRIEVTQLNPPRLIEKNVMPNRLRPRRTTVGSQP